MIDDFFNPDYAPIFDALAEAKRKKYFKRWHKMSDSKKLIDLNVPQIRIEWLLCDLRYQVAITSEDTRHYFLDLLGEDAKETYLNFVDDDGNRYVDLENPKNLEIIKKDLERIKKLLEVKNLFKGKNHNKIY